MTAWPIWPGGDPSPIRMALSRSAVPALARAGDVVGTPPVPTDTIARSPAGGDQLANAAE
jgi:hypothetical protein